jgi:hypothetical protein
MKSNDKLGHFEASNPHENSLLLWSRAYCAVLTIGAGMHQKVVAGGEGSMILKTSASVWSDRSEAEMKKRRAVEGLRELQAIWCRRRN